MEDDDIVAEAEGIARAAHEAIARLDIDALRTLLDESVVWHGPDGGDADRTHRGREAVISALMNQQQATPIQLIDVRAEPEPEVVGFSFDDVGGSSTVLVATHRIEHPDGLIETEALIVVQQGAITELGPIDAR